MRNNIVVLLDKPEGRKLIRQHCLERGFDINFMEELIDAELKQIGKQKKIGLWTDFDDILDRVDAEKDASHGN